MGEPRLIPNPDYLTPEALANLCCDKTGGKKRNNSTGGFQVRCPAHPDHDASLSINQGDKGTLVNCFAGCTSVEVLASLGLKESQLFSARFGSNPNKQVSGLRIKKNSDYSDYSANSDNSANSVTIPFLTDMPKSARPKECTPEAVSRALFNLIRWLALDRGLREGETMPKEARETVEAWRVVFTKMEDTMTIEEQAASMWVTAKTPIKEGAVIKAFQQAKDKTPKTCPGKFKGTAYEHFFGVCYYLAEKEADGIFFVPVREMEDALGLGNAMKPARMFRLLVTYGVLFKKAEFKEHGRKADRYQLNPDYSSDPERKNRITVASWHRYTKSQIINMPPSNVQLAQVREIQTLRGLNFNAEDFCRRGEAAHWRADYGLDLKLTDMEAAVLSYAETSPVNQNALRARDSGSSATPSKRA